jgi:hypothetical protein
MLSKTPAWRKSYKFIDSLFQYTANPLDAFLLKLYFLVPYKSYEEAIHTMILLTILHVELDRLL